MNLEASSGNLKRTLKTRGKNHISYMEAAARRIQRKVSKFTQHLLRIRHQSRHTLSAYLVFARRVSLGVAGYISAHGHICIYIYIGYIYIYIIRVSCFLIN